MPESFNKTLKVTEQIQWRVGGWEPAVVNSEPTSLFIVSSCLSKPREILLSVLFGGRSVCCRRSCQMKSPDARSTPSDTLHLHELQRDKQQLHRCAQEIHRQPLALVVKSMSAWKLFEGDSDQCWHSLKRQWQKQQKPQPTEKQSKLPERQLYGKHRNPVPDSPKCSIQNNGSVECTFPKYHSSFPSFFLPSFPK